MKVDFALYVSLLEKEVYRLRDATAQHSAGVKHRAEFADKFGLEQDDLILVDTTKMSREGSQGAEKYMDTANRSMHKMHGLLDKP